MKHMGARFGMLVVETIAEDSSDVFRPEIADQGDLPRARSVAQVGKILRTGATEFHFRAAPGDRYALRRAVRQSLMGV